MLFFVYNPKSYEDVQGWLRSSNLYLYLFGVCALRVNRLAQAAQVAQVQGQLQTRSTLVKPACVG